jgi:anti-sigma regulatory factor (Ser/Thr protein kinase)
MTATRSFPGEARSITDARRFARETLTELPGEARDAVELMVSELATNSVKHGKSDFTLTIRVTGSEVRVEVHDRGTGQPRLGSPAPADPTGRGLKIVDTLASSWGSELTGDGKSVWFELGGLGPG